MIKHKLLTANELPRPGTLIAIDAEFVALQQEEMEFRSDGTKSVLKPSHLSLARVSVLRGDGEMEGVPFIDDYIHTSEVVKDYLTEFSGIKSESESAVGRRRYTKVASVTRPFWKWAQWAALTLNRWRSGSE
jgi:hypothetical protein